MKNKFYKFLINIHKKASNPFFIFDNNLNIFYKNKAFETQINNLENVYALNENDKEILLNKFNFNKLIKYTRFVLIYINSYSSYYSLSCSYIFSEKNTKYFCGMFTKLRSFQDKIITDSVNALVTASQLKDNDTGNHIVRINSYAHLICSFINKNLNSKYPEINGDYINAISKYSSMHDIGKIGTPDYILTKPSKLNEEERKIMNEHTINGALILSKLAGSMARDIALFHHERWDGTGYPYGLKGDSIPLCARIVAIGDVYDALRMPRIYKEAFTHEKSYNIIMKDKGAHFDPEMIDIFDILNKDFENVYNKLIDKEIINFHAHNKK